MVVLATELAMPGIESVWESTRPDWYHGASSFSSSPKTTRLWKMDGAVPLETHSRVEPEEHSTTTIHPLLLPPRWTLATKTTKTTKDLVLSHSASIEALVSSFDFSVSNFRFVVVVVVVVVVVDA